MTFTNLNSSKHY